MKIGMKFLCAATLLAVLLAVFCESSCLFMSAKSAEAGEMSINYADTVESRTVSAGIQADESTMLGRIWNILLFIGAIILGLAGLVFFFSGGWVLLVIGSIIIAVFRYIFFGQ